MTAWRAGEGEWGGGCLSKMIASRSDEFFYRSDFTLSVKHVSDVSMFQWALNQPKQMSETEKSFHL